MVTIIRSPELQALRERLYDAFHTLDNKDSKPEEREQAQHLIEDQTRRYLTIAQDAYSIPQKAG